VVTIGKPKKARTAKENLRGDHKEPKTNQDKPKKMYEVTIKKLRKVNNPKNIYGVTIRTPKKNMKIQRKSMGSP